MGCKSSTETEAACENYHAGTVEAHILFCEPHNHRSWSGHVRQFWRWALSSILESHMVH